MRTWSECLFSLNSALSNDFLFLLIQFCCLLFCSRGFLLLFVLAASAGSSWSPDSFYTKRFITLVVAAINNEACEGTGQFSALVVDRLHVVREERAHTPWALTPGSSSSACWPRLCTAPGAPLLVLCPCTLRQSKSAAWKQTTRLVPSTKQGLFAPSLVSK